MAQPILLLDKQYRTAAQYCGSLLRKGTPLKGKNAEKNELIIKGKGNHLNN